MLLTSSDTKRTLMHLFLFTKSAQRELVSIFTQRICDRNYLSLHYNLGYIIHLDRIEMISEVSSDLSYVPRFLAC